MSFSTKLLLLTSTAISPLKIPLSVSNFMLFIFIKYYLSNIYIPKKTIHRIENIGKEDLIFIEIQLGENLKEEDIIRLEDDYGRI